MSNIDTAALVALFTDPETADMDAVQPAAREFAALPDPRPALGQLNDVLATLGIGGYTAELVTADALPDLTLPPEGCTYVVVVRPYHHAKPSDVGSLVEAMGALTFWAFHPESGVHQLSFRLPPEELAAEHGDALGEEVVTVLLAEMSATALQLQKLIGLLEPQCETDLHGQLLLLAKAHLHPDAGEMVAELSGQEPSQLDPLVALGLGEQALRALVAVLGHNYGAMLELARRS